MHRKARISIVGAAAAMLLAAPALAQNASSFRLLDKVQQSINSVGEEKAKAALVADMIAAEKRIGAELPLMKQHLADANYHAACQALIREQAAVETVVAGPSLLRSFPGAATTSPVTPSGTQSAKTAWDAMPDALQKHCMPASTVAYLLDYSKGNHGVFKAVVFAADPVGIRSGYDSASYALTHTAQYPGPKVVLMQRKAGRPLDSTYLVFQAKTISFTEKDAAAHFGGTNVSLAERPDMSINFATAKLNSTQELVANPLTQRPDLSVAAITDNSGKNILGGDVHDRLGSKPDAATYLMEMMALDSKSNLLKGNGVAYYQAFLKAAKKPVAPRALQLRALSWLQSDYSDEARALLVSELKRLQLTDAELVEAVGKANADKFRKTGGL